MSLPYEGPGLYELWTTAWVSADLDRSTVRLQGRCRTCGTERWDVHGVERWDSAYDRERRQLVRTRIGRRPESGIYLPRADLHAADVFRIVQFPGWVCCTDYVRDLVCEQQFTNVDLLELGEAT